MNDSWCDIVQSIAAVIGLVPIFVAGCKWLNEKKISHLQFVESLANRRRSDDVSNLFVYVEQGDKVFSTSDVQFVKCLETTMTFLSQVCLFRNIGKISKNEFMPYEADIRKLFKNEALREHILNVLDHDSTSSRMSKWAPLLETASKMGLPIHESLAQEDNASIADYTNDGQNPVSCHDDNNDIKLEDFDKPTMVIKINRLYRDGMSGDEIFHATRGWWRLNLESAKKVCLVLAVANGLVKGVYSAQKWMTHPVDTNRVGFEGCEAEAADVNKFIGKSVRQLFTKGAANPVRYFGMS